MSARTRRAVLRLKKLALYALRLGPLRGPRVLRRLARRSPEPVDLRLPGLAHAVRLRPGTSDVVGFQEVFLDRDYAVELPAPPRLIVDVGANVGLTALYFAHRYPGARIVAVEPDPENLALLRHNTAPYPNVACTGAAVWPRAATLEVIDASADPDSLRFAESGNGEPATDGVPGVPLEELLRRHGVSDDARLDLVKLDVEGAEADLFRRRPPWLDRVDALVIELHEELRPGCTALVERHLPPHLFRHRLYGVNHLFLRRRQARAARDGDGDTR